MLLTEREAREHWCPHVRHEFEERPSGSFNRAPYADNAINLGEGETVDDGEYLCNCIASGCMMWRWSDKIPLWRTIICDDPVARTEPDKRPKSVPASWEWLPFDIREGEPAQWVEPAAEFEARHTGYCGLAGRVPA